jgi:UDP-N-acetylmuramyl pentapeptide phosphotransferase/UDP-N-acetylglucosamine-1-phosphate transferase
VTALLATFWLRPIDGINLLILLLLVWVLIRIVRHPTNDIEWADYISTKGTDGRQRGDINKIGQWGGIVIAVMSVLMYADNEKVEPTGLSVLLGVALLYLGGVAGYAASLRAKQGTVTTVTEPATEPAPTKITVIETPPPERKAKK